VVHNRKQIILL